LRHRLQVFNRDLTGMAVDGTTIRIDRLLHPRERRGQESRRPIGPCLEGVVNGGEIEIVPLFTENCPEGALVIITVDFHDGRPPITASAEPAIEWRRADRGEATRQVVVRPVQPHTAADVGDQPAAVDQPSWQTSPPSTGEGAISNSPAAMSNGEKAGLVLGLGVALGVGLFAVSFSQKFARR
jgi:hypothetical protein